MTKILKPIEPVEVCKITYWSGKTERLPRPDVLLLQLWDKDWRKRVASIDVVLPQRSVRSTYKLGDVARFKRV